MKLSRARSITAGLVLLGAPGQGPWQAFAQSVAPVSPLEAPILPSPVFDAPAARPGALWDLSALRPLAPARASLSLPAPAVRPGRAASRRPLSKTAKGLAAFHGLRALAGDLLRPGASAGALRPFYDGAGRRDAGAAAQERAGGRGLLPPWRRGLSHLREMAQGQAEIRPLLKPYRGQMNLARAMLILKAALSSATAYATGAFVDAAIAHSTGPALLWLGAIAGATALQMIDRRFYSIVVGRLTVRVRRDFRVRLFSGLLKSGELKEKPAELASRLSGDVGRITVKNVFIPVQFPHLVIQLALAMGLVVYSSPSLALLIGASVPLLAWVARFYGRRLASLEEAAATRQAGMTHTGMGLLEIAPRREGVRRAVRSYARAAGRYEKVNFKLVEAGADLDALRETLQLLFTDVLVLGLGLLSFLHFGAPSVGQVMSMRGYARDLRSAVDGFIDAYVGGKDAEGGTRRVIELLRGSQASRRKG